MTLANPWGTSRVRTTGFQEPTPEYPEQQYRDFSAPSLEAGDAYNDEFGWAPKLASQTSSQETPSAQRLQTMPRIDRSPNPVRPPEEWYRRLDADEASRHSVEDQNAIGWTEGKGIAATDRRWAEDPRRTPPPEPRLTNQLAPRSYSFTRPFDQDLAREFNGMHFSMADHRRQYDILGMAPVRSARNTYRIEPRPWDEDIVDLPPESGYPSARVQSVEVPSSGTRAFRLV